MNMYVKLLICKFNCFKMYPQSNRLYDDYLFTWQNNYFHKIIPEVNSAVRKAARKM